MRRALLPLALLGMVAGCGQHPATVSTSAVDNAPHVNAANAPMLDPSGLPQKLTADQVVKLNYDQIKAPDANREVMQRRGGMRGGTFGRGGRGFSGRGFRGFSGRRFTGGLGFSSFAYYPYGGYYYPYYWDAGYYYPYNWTYGTYAYPYAYPLSYAYPYYYPYYYPYSYGYWPYSFSSFGFTGRRRFTGRRGGTLGRRGTFGGRIGGRVGRR